MIIRRRACRAVPIPDHLRITSAVSLGAAYPNQDRLTDRSHDLSVALHHATIKGHGSISFTRPSPVDPKFYRLRKP